jgi:fatty acid desaturase
MDDYTRSFHQVRSSITDSKGRKYVEFVRGLQPDYRRVQRDIAFGYAMLLATAGLTVLLSHADVWPALIVVFGAVSFGYWIAYLQLFIHEGAHFNLAAGRDESDRLCNFLIAWMIGTSVQKYRVVHFQHHRAVGSIDDSEFSYFFPLNLVFIFKSLTGWRALEVFFSRKSYLESVEEKKRPGKSAGDAADTRILLIGIVAHAVIVTLLFLAGGVVPALSWILGIGVVFPFLGALRQILEHRDENADPHKDYTRENHGAYTRMFGDDLFSSTFGGAGFNRHLLHHWEPQVSYTNLPELERFLADSQMGSVIDSRRSSYSAVLLKLISLN